MGKHKSSSVAPTRGVKPSKPQKQKKPMHWKGKKIKPPNATTGVRG